MEFKLDKINEAIRSGNLRIDASDLNFFSRQLESLRVRVLQKRYQNLDAMSLVPVNTDIDPIDKSYTYTIDDYRGKARWLGSLKSQWPMVGVDSTEETAKLHWFGIGYQLTVDEMRASAKYRKALPERKAMAARKAAAIGMDNSVLFGRPDLDDPQKYAGLYGLFNAPRATIYTPSSAAAWDATTSPRVVTGIVSGVISTMKTDTNGVIRATDVAFSDAMYEYLANTQRSDASDASILDYLRTRHRGVTFHSRPELAGAGAGSTKLAPIDRIVVWEKDSETMEFLAPEMFEQFAPELEGMIMSTHTRSKTGGLILHESKGLYYCDVATPTEIGG